MRWPSPWGEGYPGWHIECSVMSTKYLGQPFDIHGGGLENIFPHNECEIAQAEAYHGVDFARYWLLVGSLTVNGVKMSKSLGNFLTIRDALKLYTPEAIRYFILSSHYRGPVDFSREALQAAQRGIDRLHNAVRKLRLRMRQVPPAGTAVLADVGGVQDYRTAFREAMEEDFNTPQALAVLFEFVKEVNRYLDEHDSPPMGTLTAMDKVFRDLGGKVLGVVPDKMTVSMDEDRLGKVIQMLLDLRQEYRQARNWSKADAIRSRLAEIGIIVNDGPEGSTWELEH